MKNKLSFILISFVLTGCSSVTILNMNTNPITENFNLPKDEGFELFFIYSPKNDLTFVASFNNGIVIYPFNIKLFLKSQLSYISDKYDIQLNASDFECNIYFDLENNKNIITPIKSTMNIYYNFEINS